MAEEENPEDEEILDGEDEDEESSAKGGKKRILIVVGAALFLLVGGFAAAWFSGVLDPLLGSVEKDDSGEEVLETEAVFYDLPEILVNLNTGGRKATFLKIRISLELVAESDVVRIEEVMPRILDNFQVYLRELRIEDLKGSAGMYRLREELLTRVTAAVMPIKVNDVLFKEMIIQ